MKCQDDFLLSVETPHFPWNVVWVTDAFSDPGTSTSVLTTPTSFHAVNSAFNFLGSQQSGNVFFTPVQIGSLPKTVSIDVTVSGSGNWSAKWNSGFGDHALSAGHTDVVLGPGSVDGGLTVSGIAGLNGPPRGPVTLDVAVSVNSNSNSFHISGVSAQVGESDLLVTGTQSYSGPPIAAHAHLVFTNTMFPGGGPSAFRIYIHSALAYEFKWNDHPTGATVDVPLLINGNIQIFIQPDQGNDPINYDGSLGVTGLLT